MRPLETKNFKLKIKLIKKVSKTHFSQPRNKEKADGVLAFSKTFRQPRWYLHKLKLLPYVSSSELASTLFILPKAILKTLAARKFYGFARLDGNRFAGRRIASLPFRPLAELEFSDSGKLHAAVLL